MEKQIDTLQQQLKQQEKLASLGMLSAGIAHEIQNPLNFVINFSKMSDKLLRDLTEIVEDNEKNIPQDLSRAVLNLMNNACYTVWNRAQKEDEGYVPTIDIKTALKPDGMVEVSIQDNGEGMSDEVKVRLYENFFTTKPVGQGTGLGMGITRDIVENKHHGKLTFE